MGMFDKDAFFRAQMMTEWVDKDEPFLLWGVAVTPSEITTNIGKAYGAILHVSPVDSPDNKTSISTFAQTIVERCRDAEESDFPVVVKWTTVPGSFGTDATILEFVGSYATQPEAQS